MESKIIVLTADEKPEDIIDKAYDVIVKTEVLSRTNGYETLEFKIPFNYSKRDLLFNERKLEVDERRYIIKLIDDSKSKENITTITCDATWYELADGELLDHKSTAKFTARGAIDEQLVGTDWTSGVVEIETVHQFTLNDKNTRLYNLRYIHQTFGGDMWFDTKNKTVNLYSQMGEKTNNIFKYNRNITEIKRTIDTRNLITRFTLTGKDGLTFEDVNGGIPYVENYDYYDQMGLPRTLKSYEKQDDRFTNTAYMKWYAEQWLEQYAHPTITYQITPAIIHDDVDLGDYIYVIDSQLGLEKWLRILVMEENKGEPWKSKYTLENVYSDISDILNEESEGLSSTNVVDVDNQFANMSPFNLLLNSSGDDGLTYWQSIGFEVDETDGDSGYNCFKTSSGSGMKTLSQTIYPRTKSNYTISASFEPPEGYQYSVDDEIGVEVTITYDDGSTQTEFVSLFGVMNGEETTVVLSAREEV